MTAYLDNAATTRVCPEAAQAAYETMLEGYGNPSSTHRFGREAKTLLDKSRHTVAKALGAKPEELFFTSCGSESDNWALLSGAELMKRRGSHIISSQAEHAAVLRSLDLLERRGFTVTRLAPEKDGSVRPEAVAEALRQDTVLVSLMLVNNETGGVTDIAEISKEIKKSGAPALLHTDAVQGFLKLPFTAKSLGADLISISGHKVHAPKGIGALYVRGGVKGANLAPLIIGGGQEAGKRAGTENLPQIAAFAAAVETGFTNMKENAAQIAALKALAMERLTQELPGVVLIPSEAPHILSFSLPEFKSEVLMNFLDARGVFVSNSSACKKGAKSYVLEAMGLSPERIGGSLRVSFSRFSTSEDVNALVEGLKEAVKRLYTILH